jgi:RHS repeat-associated protein
MDTIDNGVCDTMWTPAGQALTRGIAGLTDGVYYWQVRATTAGGSAYADLGAWWKITVDAPDPIREYIYLGSKLLATITLSTGAPVTSYYHTDALGSVRAITDPAGATVARHDYFPFGESTSPMTGDPRRFTSKERDAETAFDYFEARYYRNVWGRFTAVDPGQASGSAGDPQGWNAYAYARNNPR